jgi:death-on-curing protein
MQYLTSAEILFIHSAVIEETGGLHGVRDLGLMESAAAQPRQSFAGKDLYPTLEDKAAALLCSLIKNHPFVDGNKRTAVTVMAVFLGMNGHALEVPSGGLVRFALQHASGKADIARTSCWLRAHIKKLK